MCLGRPILESPSATEVYVQLSGVDPVGGGDHVRRTGHRVLQALRAWNPTEGSEPALQRIRKLPFAGRTGSNSARSSNVAHHRRPEVATTRDVPAVRRI